MTMWGAALCGAVTAGETQSALEVSNAAMSKDVEDSFFHRYDLWI